MITTTNTYTPFTTYQTTYDTNTALYGISLDTTVFNTPSLQIRSSNGEMVDVLESIEKTNKRLAKIEERLALLNANDELESRWDELRNLRNLYIKMEKELCEKERVWDMLK